MPNATNIRQPINVFGLGRSGTTLVCAAISNSLNYQNCAETSDAVFSTYAGYSWGLSDDREGGASPHIDMAVSAVHGSLMCAMASSKKGWVQKLAGIPKLVSWHPFVTPNDKRYGGADLEFPYEWYWRAIRRCFPESINILCIRNPLDIVASRVSMSGWNAREVWHDCCLSAQIYMHQRAEIDAVFDLTAYHANPKQTVDRLCKQIDLDISAGFEVLKNTVQAPDPNSTYAWGFDRSNRRDEILSKIRATEGERNLLMTYHRRFNAIPPFVGFDVASYADTAAAAT